MADHGLVAPIAGGVTVTVQVTPKARRPGIQGIAPAGGGRPAIRVAVAAAPEEGKANAALIALLARAWGVPRRSIALRTGAASRCKLLAVSGDPAALTTRIEQSVKEFTDG